jgi:hypothetical protein
MGLGCTQEVREYDDAVAAKGLADERVLAHRLVCHGEVLLPLTVHGES